MATILTKRSNTASSVPVAGDLTNSTGGAELAVNTADKRLFTKDSGGTVVELGTNPSSVTLPNGTANGVPYLNGSKVLTSGSALTFDGTNLGVGSASNLVQVTSSAYVRTTNTTNTSGFDIGLLGGASSAIAYIYNRANADMVFGVNNAEKMRLTSTGLGIGTSSPDSKLHVVSGASTTLAQLRIGYNGTSVNYYDANTHYFRDGSGPTNRMVLDSSGNLGLGVTPSAWNSNWKAIESSGASGFAIASANVNPVVIGSNWYSDSGGNKYKTTGAAALFETGVGVFKWNIAPSGTAGNAISFTQAMTLNANGQLLLGTTSAGTTDAPLIVSNAGAAGMEFSPTAISGENRLLSYNRSTSAYAGFTLSASDIKFQTGGTERARIDSSGNFGIGTTSPDTGVHLRVYGNAYYTAQYGTGNKGRFGADATGAFIDAVGATPLVFQTNTTERARIDSSGRFLIGTTSGIANGTLCVKSNYAGAEACSFQGGSNNYIVTFHNTSGTLIGSITGSTGSTTSYNTSSDYRLKEDIQPMTGALAKVAALKPVTYKWKADGSDGQGFIAHELAEVCPDAVSGEKDAVNEDGSIKPQGIDTSFLVATLTAALQELKAEVDSLKSEINTLKGI